MEKSGIKIRIFLLTNGKWCGKIRKLFVRTDGVKQKMKRFVRKKFLTNKFGDDILIKLSAKNDKLIISSLIIE